MGLLHWLKKSKNEKQRRDQKASKAGQGIPIVESLSFRIHLEMVAREFSFLTEEYGFLMTEQDWHSREHVTLYGKGGIQVEVVYEPGSLPNVKVRNTTLPYDESKNLYNLNIVEEFDSEISEIRKRYIARREPMRERAMKEWNAGGELDFSELEEDYMRNGREEHIRLLAKAAVAVRHMLDTNWGVLSR